MVLKDKNGKVIKPGCIIKDTSSPQYCLVKKIDGKKIWGYWHDTLKEARGASKPGIQAGRVHYGTYDPDVEIIGAETLEKPKRGDRVLIVKTDVTKKRYDTPTGQKGKIRIVERCTGKKVELRCGWYIALEDIQIMPPIKGKKKVLRDATRCDKNHLLLVDGEPTSINKDGVCLICHPGRKRR